MNQSVGNSAESSPVRMTSTTTRNVFTKMELLGDMAHQQKVVQKVLFKDMDLPDTALSLPAKDSQHWKTIEDVLYSEAKKSYDSIIQAFLRSPRVYKLEAIKEKMSADLHGSARRNDGSATPSSPFSKKKRKKIVNTSTPPVISSSSNNQDKSLITQDEEVNTYLDPFLEKDEQPVWKEKLHLLEKLTPREELDGYDYREDYDEQQFRLSLQRDYQERLMAEIQRRVENPSELEQVEDVLFDLIEFVVEDLEADKKKTHLEAQRKKILENPVTQSRRLKSLQSIEDEKGQITQIISDAEFVDVIITPAGLVLPKTIPGQVIAQHKEEKRIAKALQQKIEQAKEEERRKPLSSKLRSAVLLAKEDLSGAIRQMMRDIVDKTIVLPSRPVRAKCSEVIAQGSQGLISLAKDPQAAMDSLVDFMMDTYDRVMEPVPADSKVDIDDEEEASTNADRAGLPPIKSINKLTLEQLEHEAKKKIPQDVVKLDDEVMESFQDHDYNTSITVAFPDAIMLKCMLYYDPPPAYVFRPKKTLKKKLKKLKRQTMQNIKEKKEKLQEAWSKFAKTSANASASGNGSVSGSGGDNKKAPLAQTSLSAEEINEEESHERVNTKKIVGDPSYTGYIKPEEMFVYEIEDEEEEEEITFVYDSSERQSFVANFIEQLANASCLQSDNFTVEQVRRLEVDNQHLLEAIERKRKQVEEFQIEKEVERLRDATQALLKKATTQGILWTDTKAHRLALAKRIGFGEPTNHALPQSTSARLLLMDGIDVGISNESSLDNSDRRTRKIVSKLINELIEKIENNEADGNSPSIVVVQKESQKEEEVDEDTRKDVMDLLQDLVNLIEKKHQLAEELNFVFANQDVLSLNGDQQPAQVEVDLEDKVGQNNVKSVKSVRFLDLSDEEQGNDVVDAKASEDDLSLVIDEHSLVEREDRLITRPPIPPLAVSQMGLSSPVMPLPFLGGLQNPDNILRNSKANKNWQSQNIRKLQGTERLAKIFKYLPELRRHYEQVKFGKVYVGVKAQWQEMKDASSEWKEDFMDNIQPLLLQYKQVLEKARPYFSRFQAELSSILNFFITAMKEVIKFNSIQSKLLNQMIKELYILQQQQQSSKTKSSESVGPSVLMPLVGEVDSTKEMVKSDIGIVVQREESIRRVMQGIVDNLIRTIELNNSSSSGHQSEQLAVVSHMVRDTIGDTESAQQNIDTTSSVKKVSESAKSVSASSIKKSQDEELESDGKGAKVESVTSNRESLKEESLGSTRGSGKEQLSGGQIKVIEGKAEQVDEATESEQNREQRNANDETQENSSKRGESNEKKIVESEKKKEEEEEVTRPKEGQNKEESKEEKEDKEEKEERVEEEEEKEDKEVEQEKNEEEEEDDDEEEEEDDDEEEEEEKLEDKEEDNEGQAVGMKEDTPQVAKLDDKENGISSKVAIVEEKSGIQREGSSNLQDDSNDVISPSRMLANDDYEEESEDGVSSSSSSKSLSVAMLPSTVQLSSLLRDSIWLRDPVEADQLFWHAEILSSYDADIVSVLNQLCDQVMEKVGLVVDEERQDKIDQRKFGCEISVIIRIHPEQRQAVAALHDLMSSDIGEYLLHQLVNPLSDLNSQPLTGTIVDIRYVTMYQRRPPLESWISYWIHILHPSFFHYAVNRSRKLQDGAQNSLESPSLASAALPIGMKVINPIHTLNPRAKQAFQALATRPLNTNPMRDDAMEGNGEEDDRSLSFSFLDLTADELSHELRKKGPQIYRPNMNHIDEKVVERAWRVYKQFQLRYEEAMLPGLINNSLNPFQYEALKTVQTTFRIFRSVKQRYDHNIRHELQSKGILSEDHVVPFVITTVSQDTYDAWVEEVRKEDHDRRLVLREKAAKRKEQLLYEARLRKQSEEFKSMLMEMFIHNYLTHRPSPKEVKANDDKTEHVQDEAVDDLNAFPTVQLLYDDYYEYSHDSLELHDGLRKALDEGLRGGLSSSEMQMTKLDRPSDNAAITSSRDLVVERKKTQISEEKRTRRLFEFMQSLELACDEDGQWQVRRTNPPQGQHQLDVDLSSMQVVSSIMEDILDIIWSKIGETPKEDGVIVKEKVYQFIDFVSSVLLQMENVQSSMQYVAFRSRTLNEVKSRRRLRAIDTSSRAGTDGLNTPSSPTSRPITTATTLSPTARQSNNPLGSPTSSRASSAFPESTNSPHNVEGSTLIGSRPPSGKTSAKTIIESEATQEESENRKAHDAEEDESEAQHSFFFFSIENYSLLSREEWDFLRKIEWLKAVREHPPFFDCLRQLPTKQSQVFLRDELVQFSALLVELFPLLHGVIKSLNHSKYEAELALGIHKKDKRVKSRQRRRGKSSQGKRDDEGDNQDANKNDDDKPVVEDGEKKVDLDEVLKQAERDRAWFMAHPHRFLRPIENLKGQPFCIVCKQKAHEYWIKVWGEEEVKWKQEFSKLVEKAVSEAEEVHRHEIENEMKAELEAKAIEVVRKSMAKESNLPMITEETEEKEGKDELIDDNQSEISQQPSLSAADEELLKWEEDMRKVTQYILRYHFCLVDAHGRSILPPKPAKRILASMTNNQNDRKNSTSNDMITRPMMGEFGEEPPGLKICVFHRNELGERSKFLGMVEIQEKELKKPPKGMRLYHLKPDASIIESDPIPISGNLAVLLTFHNKQSKTTMQDVKDSVRWKLQLKKLMKLPSVDREAASPYCEVYWKGPAWKHQTKIYLHDWTIIGQTKTKIRVAEVVYNHRDEEDNSIFELPPIWTSSNIPQRGLKESDIAFGGYMARNQLIEMENALQGKKSEIVTKSGKVFNFGQQASLEEILQYRAHLKYKELLSIETKLYCEARRLMLLAEERERFAMSEEEKKQREVAWLTLKFSYAPALQVQENYAKEFQKLLDYVVHPSTILNRLRFLMGEDNVEISFPKYPHLNKKKNSTIKGTPNTLVIRCQDCSTNEVVRVICTPILNQGDENFMRDQALTLVGRISRHNTKIFDFAVHDIASYDSNGFRAIQERMAVVIMECVDGPTMMDYLWENWEKVTEKDFCQMLTQIAMALEDLHRDHIIHRNFSPHCVQLQLPTENISLRDNPFNVIMIKLGNYWFLENPREEGCDRSQGRADWGYLLTAPPELTRVQLKANKFTRSPHVIEYVTDRSDIYAFGVCVFYWVTKGELLPTNHFFENNMDVLKNRLPLKWGSWLLQLLRMCLVIDPTCRASAKEIVQFLQSRRFA